MTESTGTPPTRSRGLAKREIILVTITAVLFGAIGVVVGGSNTSSGHLNDLSSSTASPSVSPTPGTVASEPDVTGTCLDATFAAANQSQCTVAVPSLSIAKLDLSYLDAQQAQLQKQLSQPITISGGAQPQITIVSCGQPGGYVCGNPTQQIGVSANGDEATAAALVTPSPTTVDGRRAAVFLHALTLDPCAGSSNSCPAPDKQLAAAIRTSVQNLRIAEATDAYALWEKFLSDPCHFVAPYSPSYEPPDTCFNPLSFGTLYGEKDTTPSEAQFVAWGRQQALAGIMTPLATDIANALPASLNLLTPNDDSVAKATGALDTAGRLAPQFAAAAATGAVQAGGLSAVQAVGGASKVPLFAVLFPNTLVGTTAAPGASASAIAAAARLAARAAAVLVDSLSFSVGIILAAGAILVQRVIDLANATDPSQVSSDLLAGVVTAKATLPTIASLVTDPTHEGPTDMLDVLAAGFGQTTPSANVSWDGSNRNVLTNPDGESNDPAYGLAPRNVYGWDAGGTGATVRAYNDPTTDGTADCSYYTENGYPCTDPNNELTGVTSGNGKNYFWGGANNGFSTLTQTVGLAPHKAKSFTLSEVCEAAHGSAAAIQLTWMAGGKTVGTPVVSQCTAAGIPVIAATRHTSGSVPSGAVLCQVKLEFARGTGSYASISTQGRTEQLVNNDAGLDSVSLTFS